MSDHVLGDINGNELLAIMHRHGVANEFRCYRGPSGPRLYNLFFSGSIPGLNFFHEASFVADSLPALGSSRYDIFAGVFIMSRLCPVRKSPGRTAGPASR